MATKPAISVVVFRGDPIDFQKYRHTGILFEFENQQSTFIHITGSARDYDVHVRGSYDPSKSEKYAGRRPLGRALQAISPHEISSLAYDVTPDNKDTSYSCQTWVGDALKRMQEAGWIDESTVKDGIDGMVDLVLEAGDEDEP